MSKQDPLNKLPISAVLMAGGKGTRLLPLTKKIPKPLLKVNDKEIILYNYEALKNLGVDEFFITVNYLKDQIVDFFSSLSEKEAQVNFVEESKFLGTIGALSLIHNFKHDTILLMNSDLLTNINFSEMFKHHQSLKNDVTIATKEYQVKVPYAVLETKNNRITSIKEKPTLKLKSNAGIYMINNSLLSRLQPNEFCNAPDFVEDLINEDFKVGYFDIKDYWLDIGKKDDFDKAQKDIIKLKF